MNDIDKQQETMRWWLDKADKARAEGDERMGEAYDYAAMIAARGLRDALRDEGRADKAGAP